MTPEMVAVRERDEARAERDKWMEHTKFVMRDRIALRTELGRLHDLLAQHPAHDDPRWDVVSRVQYVELQGEVMHLKDKLQLALDTLARAAAPVTSLEDLMHADLIRARGARPVPALAPVSNAPKPTPNPFNVPARDPRRMGP